jgi:hypothetical protein
MLNRFLLIICGLLLLIGCQQGPTSEPLAYSPDVNAIVVTEDFISKAIAATGGYEAWLNTKKLELDCVVTFYNSEGSFYLTQQHHEIYPWSDSICISAVEPQGEFVWLLSKDGLRAELPAQAQFQYDMCDTIYAVRAITTAPARLLDKTADFSESSEPVKMQGLWYYPIRCSQATGDEVREVVFYQSRDTSLIDIVSFVSGKESLLVRGYDYRGVEESALLLPTRIELFETDSAGVIQRRLLKIDYHN